ncbi:MAG: universal stress protein [Promethearchaeota archaeon]
MFVCLTIRKGGIRTYNKILVPVDGSRAALKAAGHAITIAKLMHAELEILHVILETEEDETKKRLLEDKVEESLTLFSELFGQSYISQIETVCSTQGVTMKKVIERGDPGPKIVEEAKKQDIELIVMGRRSETTEQKPLGSISEYVLKNSKCPILIVTVTAPDFFEF